MRYINDKIKENYILGNFIKLFGGQNLGALLQILSMFLIIKTVGMTDYGMLIMAQTYSYLVSDILNLQTFNAIIKFVPENIKMNNQIKAQQFIKIGFLLDFSLGFISLIIGYLFLDSISVLMGWNSNFCLIALVYLPVVLVRNSLTGTATGILRIWDKYGTIISINLAINICRVIIYMILLFIQGQLIMFVIVEILLEMMTGILLNYFSIKELAKAKLNEFYKVNISIRKNLQFISFNVYNGIALTMDLLLGNVSNMIISKLLGFDMVSIYRIFERIGSIAQRFTVPLMQLFYPEMCKHVSNGQPQHAIKLVKKFIFYAIPICVVVFFSLEISYNYWMSFFTNKYMEFFTVSLIYMIFSAFITITSPVHPLMTSFGYVKQTALFTIIIDLIYIVLLQYFLIEWGLLGLITLKLFQAIFMVIVKYCYIVLHFDHEIPSAR